MPQPPPAQGVRLEWAAVPAQVRAAVEQRLGGSVVSAISQPSGFSPGVAARLRLADRRRVFVKALSPEQNAKAVTFHRREARIAARLPAATPAPRLLWSLDDEAESGWIVLVFEDIEGRHPAQPWRSDELDRVWFVDWPHACTGAAWVDLVLLAPSVAMRAGVATADGMLRHCARRRSPGNYHSRRV